MKTSILMGGIAGLSVVILVSVMALVIGEAEGNKLYTFAQDKMDDIELSWSHENSDGCGMDCRKFRLQFEPGETISENLYRGNTCDIRHAVEMWEQSPAHLEILNKEYSQGVILIEQKGDECYIVMDVLE